MSGRTLLRVGLFSIALGVAIGYALIPMIRARATSPYEVSPIDPEPVLEPYVEGLVTIDARSHTEWAYFDFSRGSVVTDAQADGLNWDLGFSRTNVRTNSGSTNPHGPAGAIRGTRQEPAEAPETGYQIDEWEGYGAQSLSHNPAFRRWYRYNPFAAGLEPRDIWFVIRTADGGYAKLQFLSYHCPAALGGGHGCVTFRYGYRSDFSRELSE